MAKSAVQVTGRREATKTRVHSLLASVLPERFLDHYVMPVLSRRPHAPYDAKRFFDSYYTAIGKDALTDRATISPDASALRSAFHYNSVERSVIASLYDLDVPDRPRVLDVGSGAGHWIDFYLDVFEASIVTSIDISAADVTSLRSFYASVDGVEILEADVSADDFDLGTRFDLVNAIGVLFHIVDDVSFERALANLRRHLSDDGLLVVGGHFGLVTRNVEFHETDEFASFEELHSTRSPVVLVNKRVRSLRKWRATAERVGLRIVHLERTPRDRRIPTPENNVLVLARDPRFDAPA